MMRRLFILLAAFAVLAGSGSASVARPLTVVATIRPVHSLLAAIMDGAGTPRLLIRGPASVHHYKLRPSDARALQEADVVVLVSFGLEHFLRRGLSQLAKRAKIVEIGRAPGVKRLDRRRLDPPGAGASPLAAMDHDDDGIDWHVWTDPENGRAMLAALARTLADIDPDNAALYRANAERAAARIVTLTKDLERLLEPVRGKPFIVTHDATQYFEKRFGLVALASIRPGGESQPGARRLKALISLARGHPGICIFHTPEEPGKWPRLVQGEAGARPSLLDPMGSALAPGAELYPKLLEELGRAFVACLGGK